MSCITIFSAPEMSSGKFIRNLEIRQSVNIEDYYVALLRDQIAGVCLAWDMTSVKKNRVVFRGCRMNAVKPFISKAVRPNVVVAPLHKDSVPDFG